MNGFDSNDTQEEALWKLLGRGRDVQVSPYFARRVRRAIERADAPCGPLWAIWLRSCLPIAACVAVLAAAFVATDARLRQPVVADVDFDAIQTLDLLVTNYDPSPWLAPSSH